MPPSSNTKKQLELLQISNRVGMFNWKPVTNKILLSKISTCSRVNLPLPILLTIDSRDKGWISSCFDAISITTHPIKCSSSGLISEWDLLKYWSRIIIARKRVCSLWWYTFSTSIIQSINFARCFALTECCSRNPTNWFALDFSCIFRNINPIGTPKAAQLLVGSALTGVSLVVLPVRAVATDLIRCNKFLRFFTESSREWLITNETSHWSCPSISIWVYSSFLARGLGVELRQSMAELIEKGTVIDELGCKPCIAFKQDLKISQRFVEI